MRRLHAPVRAIGLLCAVVASLAVTSPAIAAPSDTRPMASPASVTGIPQPILQLTGISTRTTGGTTFIEADLSVANYAEFPDALFAPAPDLPPCGRNTNSSRTWVDIYNGQTNQYIYGFCALGRAKDLTQLWFAVRVTVGLPRSVYIRLDDRRTGTTYQSNTVSIG